MKLAEVKPNPDSFVVAENYYRLNMFYVSRNSTSDSILLRPD